MANRLSRRALALLTLGFAAPCVAADVELPTRKSGYWEIRMAHDAGGSPLDMLVHACIDAASDRAMMDAGLSMTKDMCSKSEIKKEGDGYVWDNTCKIGPMQTTSHIVLAGDFQAAYTMTITGEVVGMAKEPMKTSMTQSAKWLAADCPEGVKPGDMQMPGGMTINAKNLIDGISGAKKNSAPAQ